MCSAGRTQHWRPAIQHRGFEGVCTLAELRVCSDPGVTARGAKLLASFNSTPRLRGSLHPRGASGVLRPANAKLLALSVSVFAVLLSKYFIARITINKKAPVFRLGLFYLLGAWRCTTLAWQLPHYHRRSCVSLLSSEWIQVVPQRYCHQAKTVCLSLTK